MNLPIVHSPTFGDCLFIDNSTLEHLDYCPRDMEYFYNYRRQSSDEKAALTFGGGIHQALAHRYSQPSEYVDLVSDTPVESGMFDAMDKHFEAESLPLGDWRTADLARKIVVGYNKEYQSEPFQVLEQNGKPLVEFPFAFKLATMDYMQDTGAMSDKVKRVTWFYIGRIDLIAWEDNQIFTVDHKTTSMMGEGFWQAQRVSAQHEGYCWAWWKATGKVPNGYIINGIRTRKPLVRDENGVSKRSQRPDISPDDFQRDKVFVDLPRIMEWEFNLKSMLRRFLDYHSAQYYPLHRNQCVRKYGACQFYDVCSLAQEFRIPTLLSGNFKDVTWSPLERHEGEVIPKPDDEGPKVDWVNLMEEV